MFKVPDWEEDTPNHKFASTGKIHNKKDVKTKNKVNQTKTKNKVNKTITKNNVHMKTNKGIKKKIQSTNITKLQLENVEIKPKVEIQRLPTTKKVKQHNLQNEKEKKELNNIELDNLDLDKTDEILINAKKKKLSDKYKSEDQEEMLFSKNPRSKNKIKQMLLSSRRTINVNGNNLRERMLQRLKAAQFRYLNEKLYTSSGKEAQELFKTDPSAFHTYHQGYQQQLKKWPVNPLDVIVKRILKMPKTHVVADMGCGQAALSRRVPHEVHSFDLVASSPGVKACDMAHTPLLSNSVHAAVYCLALMGTDLARYLAEANRILKTGGHLLIAEVESRFDDADAFARNVEKLGFKLKSLDKSHQVFFFLQFTKTRDLPSKGKLPVLTLKPCLYKKR